MPQISIDASGVSVSLRFTETSFFVEPTKPNGYSITSCCTGLFDYFKEAQCMGVPLRNVISAKFATGAVEVHYLVRTHRKGRLTLATTHGTVKDEDNTRAKEWCEALVLAAYQGMSCFTLRGSF
jgi:sphingosine kinase